jgi:4-amino-4-deoxy-L-arabinose transferase-like glycosyltransferase
MAESFWKRIPSRAVYITLFCLLGLAYLAGMFVDVMDVDAAQYASMSMEMLQRRHWLIFTDGGGAYLDKPPLLFWLSAFSFKLFGISNFSYKLPSMLFTVLGVYSTYAFGRQWYGKTAGQWAALMLAACQAYFLFNNDVRTDNLLTNSVIFAIWQLSSFVEMRSRWNLLLGFIGIGLAMLAKGPIGLVIPAMALGTDLVLKRRWKLIFRWEWIVGLIITAIVISPMLYSLYTQFDLHPETVVNGEKHVSGLKFYFWTQSFGRITGESSWKNDAGYFFFVHTFAWAFLPWTICFLASFYQEIKNLFNSRFSLPAHNSEGIAIGGFVLAFIALSLSHYKLPHYIFVVMPFAALLTAKHLFQWQSRAEEVKKLNALYAIQAAVYVILCMLAVTLITLVFPVKNIVVPAIMALVFIAATISYVNKKTVFSRILVPGALIMFLVNFALNTTFYHYLLRYQATHQAAKVIRKEVPEAKLFTYGDAWSHSLNFYSRRIIHNLGGTAPDSLSKSTDLWLYTNEEGYAQLLKQPLKIARQYSFDYYSVQMLSLPFLNPVTRASTLRKTYLLHLEKEGSHSPLKK